MMIKSKQRNTLTGVTHTSGVSFTARILEIERFAIHDGPGIRTIIFFQGCPLHCPWCANPESQVNSNQLLYISKNCINCGHCVSICPQNRISFENNRPHFNQHFCEECRICVNECYQNALQIAGRTINGEDIMKTIRRDADYYHNSGGGVTFSGGEALMQIECLSALLQECKTAGIHTAVETSGHIPLEYIETALPNVDLFLFDIKHLDATKLKEVTGGNLSLILHNLGIITKDSAHKVVLRVPCIPNFNLNDEFMDNLFTLALAHGITRIDLLSYHTLGRDKYAQLDRKYNYSHAPLEKSMLITHLKRGQELGFDIRIEK